MATERTVEVEWIGTFLDGEGKIVNSTSGQLPELEVSWEGRTNEDSGLTSPEELLAAAHASCYSMALASGLVGGGWAPVEIKTSSTVALELGDELDRSYSEARERQSDPAVYNDHREAAAVGRRLKELEGPYKLAQAWRQARADLDAARGDAELAEMVPDYEAEMARLEDELK